MRIKNLALSNSPHRESGAVAVLFAILSLVLVICLAFAIDLGYAWQVKRSMVKATDAAALAAAQEARNAAVAGRPLSSGLCLNTSAAIENEARQRLTDNRADSNLEFCVIGSTPTKAKGVVTVRGNYKARLSFAGVIGKNNIDVSSSSSAKWEKAKLLPIAVCAGAPGSGIFEWIKDVSRTPLETQKLQVSSSDRSAFCSGGKSGGFAVIDLEPADGKFPGDESKRDVNKYCTRTLLQIETTFRDALSGNGDVTPINKGDFRCARTGQYFGPQIDINLCNARGTQFVLPIVKKGDATRATGDNNTNYIVEISGFALVSFDHYRGVNGATICPRDTAGPSRKRNLSKAQLVASRQRVRKHQRTKLRKAAACTTGDLSITGATWPTEIQLPKSTETTISTSIALTCTQNGSRDVASGVVINVYPGTTGLTSSAFTSINPGCSATGSDPIVITCPALIIPRSTPQLINFSVTPPSAGTIRISAFVSASGLSDSNCFNNYYPLEAGECRREARASLLVKPPLPTPNFEISAAWPPTSFSGAEIPITTKVDLSNYTDAGRIKLELRIAPGTTGLTNASILNAKLTGLPQNTCSGNTNSLTNGVIVKTCTIDVLAGETAFEVTWRINPPLAGTLDVSASATPVSPTTDNNVADNGWPRTTACSGSATCKIVITSVEPGSFREMTFSFISYYDTGSSSDITSYQICRIGIKTISEATSLGC